MSYIIFTWYFIYLIILAWKVYMIRKSFFFFFSDHPKLSQHNHGPIVELELNRIDNNDFPCHSLWSETFMKTWVTITQSARFSIHFLTLTMDSPPPKPPPQKSPFQVLPRRSELSSQNIQFLDQDIVTHQDLLTRAPLLLSDLTKECSNFDSHLLNLRRKLTKLAVSWISRSFSAKSSLSNVNFLLENLSLQTSQC